MCCPDYRDWPALDKRPKTLILGIGNILLRDEGIGVRVIEHLRKENLPEDVELVDRGTAGADLIDVLSDRQTVLIIDAVEYDASPGTVLRLSEQDLSVHEQGPLSLHDLNIPQTLSMTRLLGCAPRSVILYGVVPQTVEPGMDLSESLAPLVPLIAQKVLNETR
jgi:hydrogenase maturation protease